MFHTDALASRAVFAARVFEHAVHNPGPWSITWGPHDVPAVREYTTTGVRFSATFPAVCYLERPAATATLRCSGEVMGMRAIDFPGDVSFEVAWEFLVAEPEVAHAAAA